MMRNDLLAVAQSSQLWVRWCLVVDGRRKFRRTIDLPASTRLGEIVLFDGRPHLVTGRIYSETGPSTLYLERMALGLA